MADNLISGNSLLRAAEAVRAKREAERVSAAKASAETTAAAPIRTTSQVRATLNHIPDDASLAGMVNKALAALSRGIRWARGSIINLIV